MSKQIADLLYSDIADIKTILDQYKPRIKSPVTRIAPSPTGFLHIGTVYTGLLNKNISHRDDGIFMLRIEDTDQARNTTDYDTRTGGIYSILDGLDYFGIELDEGVYYKGDREIGMSGDYGPYIQSDRLNIYKVFVKYLIVNNLAYPCFLAPEQLEQIRESQIIAKVPTGIYGDYALSRNLSYDEIVTYIDEGKTFSIRLKSPGSLGKRVTFDDYVKGHIEIDDNYEDVVLIKSDGFPTYHFAHIVDDYLMGITHVIRTDERLPSVPKHIQIFQAFNGVFDRDMWKYAHPGPLMKIDNGNKRKLSKRKDPEADVKMFVDDGIPPDATKIYLMGLMDSSYEQWWMTNFVEQDNSDHLNITSFDWKLENINGTGAMFDIQKLTHICGEYIASVPLDKLITEIELFLTRYPNLYIYEDGRKIDLNYIKNILGFDRQKKIHTNYKNIVDYILPFSDKYFNDRGLDNGLLTDIDREVIKNFLSSYRAYISDILFVNGEISKTKEQWFEELKELGREFGFAPTNAEFKEGGRVGKTGDLAMILRVYLYGRTNTPDIYEMIKVMGKDRVLDRLSR